MSKDAQKEIREIIRKLKRHGIEVEQLPNGHYRTKTKPPVTMSFSPSDTNAARAAMREIREKLGIDIRSSAKRKDSTNDFAMQRLRERALKQMERGASIADMARMAVAAAEDKRIGGWKSTNAAEVGINGCLHGRRLVKANHDALAAALRTLESASDKDFVKHLDKAAERFGKKRLAPTAPKPEPEPATHHSTGPADGDDNLEVLAEEEHRARAADVVAIPAEIVPPRIEVTVKVELGDRTLALIERLIGR